MQKKTTFSEIHIYFISERHLIVTVPTLNCFSFKSPHPELSNNAIESEKTALNTSDLKVDTLVKMNTKS